MRRAAKRAFLLVSRALGLFHLSRRLTRDRLRILCYHGFALDDEAEFFPPLFVHPARFRERLALLARHGFPVLPLDDALRRLERGDLPDGATAITIDDGFFSAYAEAVPALETHAFPATIYVTTYYAVKQAPVFRLAVQYMFWRSRAASLPASHPWAPEAPADLTDATARVRAMWHVIEYGEARSSEQERHAISRELAELLGVDYGAICRRRLFHLMTLDAIRDLATRGFDIQLHTHRHRLPQTTEEGTRREIVENREVLEAAVGHSLRHLCYPSSIWTPHQWPWLEALRIRSATTCSPGLNGPDTHRLALTRFLDTANVSAIEFEAELYGYLELMRPLRAWVWRLLGLRMPDDAPVGAAAHVPARPTASPSHPRGG